MMKTISHITTRISTIKKNNGEHGRELYNELIRTDKSLSEGELWSIVDVVGRDEETLMAIICTQLLSTDTIFRLLRVMRFDFELCWLAFQYYESTSLHMKVLKAREKCFVLKGQNELLRTAQQSHPLPADFLSTLLITSPGYSHDMPSCVTM